MTNRYTFDEIFKVIEPNRLSGPGVRTGILRHEGHPLQVVIVSSDPSGAHKQINTMNGRRVRVTIEIMDSPAD
jgi:hypothetical protein